MFIMVDVLRKPDGNKPGMVPAVIARRKSFHEYGSDLVRLRMLLIMQNKIYARMFDSVAGFVFFAHGASFQNGVRLGSPYFGGFRDSQQRTNLGTLGFFLGRFQCLLRHRNFPDLFRRAGDHVGGEQPTKFDLLINLNTAKTFGLTISPALLGRADEVIE